MPIYEFSCKQCHAQYETLVSRHEPEVECPHCGSQQAERLLSTFGVTRRGADTCSLEACADSGCGAPYPGGPCARPGCRMSE